MRLLQDRLQAAKRLVRFVSGYQLQNGVDQRAIKPLHPPALAQGIENRLLNPGGFSIRGLFDADRSCGNDSDGSRRKVAQVQ